MTRSTQMRVLCGTVLLISHFGLAGAYAGEQVKDDTTRRIEKEVRRELVMLPFFSLFDHLSFKVEGSTVTLLGKVTRPTLKSDAENVGKRVEGVEKIINQIEVLPLSPNDDRLRTRLYRSIYGHSALQTYSFRAVPPIHIIVENGNVTLEGVVANDMQRNIAGIQAKSVSGVFSVQNNLKTDKELGN